MEQQTLLCESTPFEFPEIECGEFVVEVFRLDANSPILSIDIQVLGLALQESDAPRLLALHRLNDVTRLLTGWLATIDSEDILRISRRLRLGATSQDTLAAEIADGIVRAQALADAWRELASAPRQSAGESGSENRDRIDPPLLFKA